MTSSRRGFLARLAALAGVGLVGVGSAVAEVHPPTGRVVVGNYQLAWHCAWCNLTEADILQAMKDSRPYNWRQWTKRYARG